ncbi:hypothetical protein TRFO_37610 [Tritrichomonas foetus]|uniref:Myb-like DNA-binding domain containing protein n=1 Tax=Tritrichomonas foetus TaxID=1144522 RepID=A0A1J4JF29_9EUKA|nr:hypothetical protein TRFO_37610 [Tritrichomonas foetus]|eukprot:OHS96251.1 hypothetical protein TRFO_37610 [Tritrichomonas foetus]
MVELSQFVLPGIDDLPLSDRDLKRFTTLNDLVRNFGVTETMKKRQSCIWTSMEDAILESQVKKMISTMNEINSSENDNSVNYNSHSSSSPRSDHVYGSGKSKNERNYSSDDENINIDGIDWNQVASAISVAGRKKSPEECKARYKFKNPEIRRTPFEHWEDQIIVEERLRIGNQWTLIAKKIPGRTPCAVKNRWYSVLRHQRWTHPFLYP